MEGRHGPTNGPGQIGPIPKGGMGIIGEIN